MLALLIIYGLLLLGALWCRIWIVSALYIAYLALCYFWCLLDFEIRKYKARENARQERRRRAERWQEKHEKIYRLKRLDNQSFSGMDTEEE